MAINNPSCPKAFPTMLISRKKVLRKLPCEEVLKKTHFFLKKRAWFLEKFLATHGSSF